MATIKTATRKLIYAYVESFFCYCIERYATLKTAPTAEETIIRNPFVEALILPEYRSPALLGYLQVVEASLEQCARLIALDHHQSAQRGWALAGLVSRSAKIEIEQQVSYFDIDEDTATRPSLDAMIEAVLLARHSDDLESSAARADLFILTKDNVELFFEIKRPYPTKGQCIELTRRILRIHAVRGLSRPLVNGFFAMAYNPDGPTRADYQWSIAKTYMPFDQAVIIGQEFWSLIGGPTTYHELLEVYQEVGRDKAKYIIDSLAFGF